jgi:DNA-binding IclR family transcriptional regulator
MTTVTVDKAKVSRMVTQTLKHFHGSGAHPGEIVLALGEALGRVISAVGEMNPGMNEIVQRELVDLAIRQMTNAILVARGEKPGGGLVIPDTQVKH